MHSAWGAVSSHERWRIGKGRTKMADYPGQEIRTIAPPTWRFLSSHNIQRRVGGWVTGHVVPALLTTKRKRNGKLDWIYLVPIKHQNIERKSLDGSPQKEPEPQTIDIHNTCSDGMAGGSWLIDREMRATTNDWNDLARESWTLNVWTLVDTDPWIS